jgi:hypothetical protein
MTGVSLFLAGSILRVMSSLTAMQVLGRALYRGPRSRLRPRKRRDDLQRVITHEVSHYLQPRPVALRAHPGRRFRQVGSEQRFVAGHVRPPRREHHAPHSDLRDDEGTEKTWFAAAVQRPARERLPGAEPTPRRTKGDDLAMRRRVEIGPYRVVTLADQASLGVEDHSTERRLSRARRGFRLTQRQVHEVSVLLFLAPVIVRTHPALPLASIITSGTQISW